MFELPYTIRNSVVRFDEDRLIAWRHLGAHPWRYQLEPTAGLRTKDTETFDYSRYHPIAAKSDQEENS